MESSHLEGPVSLQGREATIYYPTTYAVHVNSLARFEQELNIQAPLFASSLDG